MGSFKKELILFTHSLVTEKETSFLLFLSSKLHLSLWFVFLSPSGCVWVLGLWILFRVWGFLGSELRQLWWENMDGNSLLTPFRYVYISTLFNSLPVLTFSCFFFAIRVLLKHWFFFMWGFLWNAICLEYDPFLVCKFYFLSVFWCSIHVYGGAFFCQHCSMIFLSMHLFLCNFFYSCEEKLLRSIRSYISFGSQGTRV